MERVLAGPSSTPPLTPQLTLALTSMKCVSSVSSRGGAKIVPRLLHSSAVVGSSASGQSIPSLGFGRRPRSLCATAFGLRKSASGCWVLGPEKWGNVRGPCMIGSLGGGGGRRGRQRRTESNAAEDNVPMTTAEESASPVSNEGTKEKEEVAPVRRRKRRTRAEILAAREEAEREASGEAGGEGVNRVRARRGTKPKAEEPEEAGEESKGGEGEEVKVARRGRPRKKVGNEVGVRQEEELDTGGEQEELDGKRHLEGMDKEEEDDEEGERWEEDLVFGARAWEGDSDDERVNVMNDMMVIDGEEIEEGEDEEEDERDVVVECQQLSDVPLVTAVEEEEVEEVEVEGLEKLVVCLGEVLPEFIPAVRENDRIADHNRISTWRSLQWVPPDFARAPGGPSGQVAVALGQMKVPVAVIGKLGADAAGRKLRSTLRAHGVSTCGIVVDEETRTGVASMEIEHQGGGEGGGKGEDEGFGIFVRSIYGNADGHLRAEEVSLDLLKQATILHCTSLSVTSESSKATLLSAIASFRSLRSSPPTSARPSGLKSHSKHNEGEAAPGKVFLDVNLPLFLWRSPQDAWAALEEVWKQAHIIEASREEFEFLTNDAVYSSRRYAHIDYGLNSIESVKAGRYEIHYEPEELSHIWHEGLELLLVTDGTLKVHYYTPHGHGCVQGTEDVLVAALTCDRSGSGDAIVAGFIRKLFNDPSILKNADRLERAIRFAISAGVIAQWTGGAIRSYPTDNAAENLTKQMYLPDLV